MADVVVDASLVAKWFVPERDHEQARAVRDDYLDGYHDLLAPALLPFEVVNALEYGGQYDGDRLVEASRALSEYGIELVPFREAGPVAEVAVELDVTLYDASYLSLARTSDSTVYTADSRLLDVVDGGAYEDVASHVRNYSSRS